MPKFAILQNNIVTNLVVADSVDDLSNYEAIVEDNKNDPAIIGWVYDLVTDNFIDPNLLIETPVEE